jgi:uncharacterized membrane protein (DUF373 family)
VHRAPGRRVGGGHVVCRRSATATIRRDPCRDSHKEGEEGDQQMIDRSRGYAIMRGFETTVVIMVGLLLAVAVAIAVVVLYVLLFSGLRNGFPSVESVGSLQVALQNVFGGVLLVLLGLELIDTLKVYFAEHQIRTEVILIVAMMAVGRHVIQIDFEHTGGVELLGTAALIVALAVSYFLVKRGARGGSVASED